MTLNLLTTGHPAGGGGGEWPTAALYLSVVYIGGLRTCRPICLEVFALSSLTWRDSNPLTALSQVSFSSLGEQSWHRRAISHRVTYSHSCCDPRPSRPHDMYTKKALPSYSTQSAGSAASQAQRRRLYGGVYHRHPGGRHAGLQEIYTPGILVTVTLPAAFTYSQPNVNNNNNNNNTPCSVMNVGVLCCVNVANVCCVYVRCLRIGIRRYRTTRGHELYGKAKATRGFPLKAVVVLSCALNLCTYKLFLESVLSGNATGCCQV